MPTTPFAAVPAAGGNEKAEPHGRAARKTMEVGNQAEKRKEPIASVLNVSRSAISPVLDRQPFAKQTARGLGFIAQLTLHIQHRSRPSAHPVLGRPPQSMARADICCGEPPEAHDVSAIEGRKAWARLLARIYDIDVLRCPSAQTGCP